MADYSGWISNRVMADYLRWYIDFFFKRDLSKYDDHQKVIYLDSMMKEMRSHLETLITNVLEDSPEEEGHYASETEDDFNKYKELRII